jgi:transcriptional regulator with XRE-family HTH domain
MLPINVEISPYKLRRARGKRSPAEVAQHAGITRQTLWNIESGRYMPSANVLARLCILYGVGLTDLLRKAS